MGFSFYVPNFPNLFLIYTRGGKIYSINQKKHDQQVRKVRNILKPKEQQDVRQHKKTKSEEKTHTDEVSSKNTVCVPYSYSVIN